MSNTIFLVMHQFGSAEIELARVCVEHFAMQHNQAKRKAAAHELFLHALRHLAIAPTCVAHYAKDKSTRLVKDKRYPMGARPYSVREYARLQGIPDSFTFPGSSTAAYRQIGNGVPVEMAEWAGRELKRYFKQQRLAA